MTGRAPVRGAPGARREGEKNHLAGALSAKYGRIAPRRPGRPRPI